MRLFKKELSVKNPDFVINRSVKLVCKRWARKGAKWSVEVNSGWPMDPTYYYPSLSKVEAVALAQKALNAKNNQLGAL